MVKRVVAQGGIHPVVRTACHITPGIIPTGVELTRQAGAWDRLPSTDGDGCYHSTSTGSCSSITDPIIDKIPLADAQNWPEYLDILPVVLQARYGSLLRLCDTSLFR